MEGAGWAGASGRWGLGAGPDCRAGAALSPMAASRFFSIETRMLISLSRCCTCVPTWAQTKLGTMSAKVMTKFNQNLNSWNLKTYNYVAQHAALSEHCRLTCTLTRTHTGTYMQSHGIVTGKNRMHFCSTHGYNSDCKQAKAVKDESSVMFRLSSPAAAAS